MKKLMTLALLTVFAGTLMAEEAKPEAEAPKEAKPAAPEVTRPANWPVFFALGEIPESPDVVGLRLTLPYSTKQESVTGIDVGLWGRCLYFEGFQLNILRNDAKDQLGGFQVGCYNSVNRGDMFGIQAGLWNEANSFRGIQVGLINVTGDAQGFQVGLVNRAEAFYGVQIGVVNVIREAEIPVLPIANIGF